MPTIRFTPLQTTPFELFRDRVFTTSRAVLIAERDDAQVQSLGVLKNMANQLVPQGGSSPFAQLLQVLTSDLPSQGPKGLAQSVAEIHEVLQAGVGTSGTLVRILDELKHCVCDPRCTDEATLKPSPTAAKLIAVLRPVVNTLTDSVDPDALKTDKQLEQWCRSRSAREGHKLLNDMGQPGLADAFRDQGRGLGELPADAFDEARRQRLGEVLVLQMRLAATRLDDSTASVEQA